MLENISQMLDVDPFFGFLSLDQSIALSDIPEMVYIYMYT